MAKLLRGADLFCGAGGSTTGAIRSGKVKVVLAVNHWQTAISSHSCNHPDVRHICAKIDDIDPRHDDLPKFDVLMASPECTHHSIARGGRPMEDQKRATPWHVCFWAEARRPKEIIVENVPEFRTWGPLNAYGKPLESKKGETFEAWLNALRSLGYAVEHRVLNAADYGAATSRRRLFVRAKLGQRSKIRWPEPTHAGRWRGAYEIIDWSKPIGSIFARKRPLADNTLARIEMGLRRFVEPFIVELRGTSTVNAGTRPLTAVTAGGRHHGLAIPFMLPRQGFYDCRKLKRPASIEEPVNTITANHSPAHIVAPFITAYHGGPDGANRQHSLLEPLPTLDTQPRFALTAPFMVDCNHGSGGGRGHAGRVRSVDEPLRAVTTKRAQGVAVPFIVPNFGERDGQDPRTHAINEPAPTITGRGAGNLVLPFICNYFGTGGVDAIDEPLSTITTKHRHGLAMVKLVETMQQLGVADILYRMLDVDELARAQGFGDGYKLYGTKEERIKQIGNAVVPDVMQALCGSLTEAA